MNLSSAITRLLEPADLKAEEMQEVMGQILSGQATPAQVAGFLVALRAKGESAVEISAACQVLRARAVELLKVTGEHLIDTCGTGGDGLNTFNISTAAAFVVAAAGGRVAKHGNRLVSSKSGSADVLEAAGVKLDLSPIQVRQCIEEIGIGFLYAPKFYGALAQVASVRRELGIRTLFNLLGPLLNPFAARHQLLGVFAARYLVPMAQVLAQLGSRHALVVHAEDGLDEISLATPTQIAELKAGEIRTYSIFPEQFGFSRAPLAAIQVSSVAESLDILRGVLAGQSGPASDIVALNAGAAIYAADLVESLASGIERARAVLKSGAALAKLHALIEWTSSR